MSDSGDDELVTPANDEPLAVPFEELPAWWGPPEQVGSWGCDVDLGGQAAEFGFELDELREFAKSLDPRRFLVCEHLSETRWAAVYVALDRVLNRQVVLKISRRPVEPEPRTAVMVRHPNVVTVFDALVIDGYPTTVMEWCSQGNLWDYAYAAKHWDELVERCIEAGRGLEHCHGLGLVHGDVKPANILICDRVAKLADFGITRGPTREGEPWGTPGYMPPERRLGEWTPAGDVYSFAATVHACLVERFEGAVPESVLAAVALGEATEPEQRPTLAVMLANLEVALERQRRKRARRSSGTLMLVLALIFAATTGTAVAIAAAYIVPVEPELEAVTELEGVEAVRRLEVERTSARKANDRATLRRIAGLANTAGLELQDAGDWDNAIRCHYLARSIYRDLGQLAGVDESEALARRALDAWADATP